jgi:hypothetical protein
MLALSGRFPDTLQSVLVGLQEAFWIIDFVLLLHLTSCVRSDCTQQNKGRLIFEIPLFLVNP